MKKFMTAVTAVSLSAMMLAGCGKTDVQETTVQESTTAETEAATETESETKVYPDEAYLDGINLGDFVELGDYKGVDVTVTRAEVTDEMVDQYIQSVLDSNKNKEEVDRAVKDGDVVDIKYVGKKDGVEFDNGSSDSYELTIGSSGDKVSQLQRQLARIALNYPAIGTVTVDGIYGQETADAVRKFQQIFNLPVTGVTDYKTWYKISQIYVGVTKIAENV